MLKMKMVFLEINVNQFEQDHIAPEQVICI